jgi:hypothetical protein
MISRSPDAAKLISVQAARCLFGFGRAAPVQPTAGAADQPPPAPPPDLDRMPAMAAGSMIH